ncbi:class I SAM-dependent methyltransferase [Paenibacillus sp. MMS18-CY102]|uniref:class I SAM-dependent methyltransferase n=1 Tax=Paenibacillus sp. MMS18-CY102 TaxID=2682849 RepID=UPI0013662A5F|nr:class I SAM-dependent methyltransferase [Paenibacillus sp. MMS18-CY102]MWC31312.1 methyltransferase domain-containing protein [Paenibacillus sp. MMS18-CY102]
MTEIDHDLIYQDEASQYHTLISKQQQLAHVVNGIRDCEGLDIVDLGAGTGRLTTALAPFAKSIKALDASAAMLQINASRLQQAGAANWTTAAADLRKLPLESQSADLIVAGWAICYLASNNAPNWEQNLQEIMAEMKRVLRPGGTIIIFENMGTGSTIPDPPSFLKPYFSELEGKYGFSHKWIRTDYQFDSLAQAEELTRFFFGDWLADAVREQALVRVPECAGVWWLHHEDRTEL